MRVNRKVRGPEVEGEWRFEKKKSTLGKHRRIIREQ